MTHTVRGRSTRPRRGALFGAALLSGLLLAGSPGCAATTGLLTGAFTGAVDAPAEVYRARRVELDRHPEYMVANVLVMGPLGFAFGPVVGFIKGLSVDIQWLLGRVRYDRSFGSYRGESVWRPYTLHW